MYMSLALVVSVIIIFIFIPSYFHTPLLACLLVCSLAAADSPFFCWKIVCHLLKDLVDDTSFLSHITLMKWQCGAFILIYGRAPCSCSESSGA